MALVTFDNRVKIVASSAPNASTAFPGMNGGAPSEFINPEAMHDPVTGTAIATGSIVFYSAAAGSLFEEGYGALDMSAHTLARANANVISGSSGAGVRVDFSGGSAPTIICSWDARLGQSSYNLMRNGIYGLEPTWTSATAFGATAGCAWIEGVNGAPLAASALADLTSQTGTSAHFYNVYASLSGGVLVLTKVDAGTAGSTTPPAAFAVPAGNARSNAAATGRFIGTLLYTGTNAIQSFTCRDMGGGRAEMYYLAETGAAAPFNILANGHATSFTALDMSGVLPNNGTVTKVLISASLSAVNVTAPQPQLDLSLDGVGYLGFEVNPAVITAVLATPQFLPVNKATTAGLYYRISDADAGVSFYIWGYEYVR